MGERDEQAGRGGDGGAGDLAAVARALVEGYAADARAHHINRRFLPSRDEIVGILQLLFQVFYPGYFGRQNLTDDTIGVHVDGLLAQLRDKLSQQIEQCLCYGAECELAADATATEPMAAEAAGGCGRHAAHLALLFLRRLPDVRRVLVSDVQAAYDGDPAATNLDEIILAYPGLLALTVFRVAHELHEMGVPLMPRIMTEWAHGVTGADIHPGATIGPRFFLDHATGVVVGETTRIGADVKLYQGVTLGAISHPRDERGRVIRGTKRHPTVADGVTVYANATVLGGETTLGEGSVVGGSVFLTRTIPDRSRVAMKPPELRVDNVLKAPLGDRGDAAELAGDGGPLHPEHETPSDGRQRRDPGR